LRCMATPIGFNKVELCVQNNFVLRCKATTKTVFIDNLVTMLYQQLQ